MKMNWYRMVVLVLTVIALLGIGQGLAKRRRRMRGQIVFQNCSFEFVQNGEERKVTMKRGCLEIMINRIWRAPNGTLVGLISVDCPGTNRSTEILDHFDARVLLREKRKLKEKEKKEKKEKREKDDPDSVQVGVTDAEEDLTTLLADQLDDPIHALADPKISEPTCEVSKAGETYQVKREIVESLFKKQEELQKKPGMMTFKCPDGSQYWVLMGGELKSKVPEFFNILK